MKRVENGGGCLFGALRDVFLDLIEQILLPLGALSTIHQGNTYEKPTLEPQKCRGRSSGGTRSGGLSGVVNTEPTIAEFRSVRGGTSGILKTTSSAHYISFLN